MSRLRYSAVPVLFRCTCVVVCGWMDGRAASAWLCRGGGCGERRGRTDEGPDCRWLSRCVGLVRALSVDSRWRLACCRPLQEPAETSCTPRLLGSDPTHSPVSVPPRIPPALQHATLGRAVKQPHEQPSVQPPVHHALPAQLSPFDQLSTVTYKVSSQFAAAAVFQRPPLPCNQM